MTHIPLDKFRNINHGIKRKHAPDGDFIGKLEGQWYSGKVANRLASEVRKIRYCPQCGTFLR